MNILILGGTSFVGPQIAQTLKDEGNFVALFTRKTHSDDRTKAFPHYQGDVRDLASLKKVAKEKKWNVVIHQVAYDRPDVENVLEAFSHLKRLILTSSISVYRYVKGHPPLQPFNEEQVDYDYKPIEEDSSDRHWSYARGKLEAEKALVRQKKVPYTILRQSFLYGPHDSHQRSLWYGHRIHHHHPIFLPDHGLNAIRLLYAPDAAKAFSQVLKKDSAENQVYNMAQDEIVTFRDFILALSHAMKTAPDLHSVPGDLIPETWKGPLGYSRNWIMSTDKARAQLGVKPTPFEKGIEATAAWFAGQTSVPLPYAADEIATQRNFLTEWDHLCKKLDHT